MASFVCPACQQRHVTLGALLACHPRQLRQITDSMRGQRATGQYSLFGMLTGAYPAYTRKVIANTERKTGDV